MLLFCSAGTVERSFEHVTRPVGKAVNHAIAFQCLDQITTTITNRERAERIAFQIDKEEFEEDEQMTMESCSLPSGH